MPSDITQMDLYQLLEIPETSSTKEITSAYRKQALLCHPDKNPDDKEKHERFLLIKDALAILTDEKVRHEYDQIRKQKQVQKERLAQMDDKRKKFKEDLERNERNANVYTERASSQRLNAEVERLRKEGSRLVDEEIEKVNTIVEQGRQKSAENHQKIVIKFYPNFASYQDEELREIFQKYGHISAIVNMPQGQKALIEFTADHLSQYIENEKGLETKPFASVKIQKQKKSKTSATPTVVEQVDLTKPELEDIEAMIFKKMAQAMNS